MGAAIHRAAHQVLEGGRIFSDPLALRILGVDEESSVFAAERDPSRRLLRLFIAARSRFAEDALKASFARGVQQLVVLGAGLDTYAYRNPLGDGLRVFEVDHPWTQAWKRRRLEEAAIPVPGNLTFAPVDFEVGALAHGLALAGYDPKKQTFFTWLGVVPYLTEEAFLSTLEFITGLPGGAQVVFDYGNPPTSGPSQDEHAATQEALTRRVAVVGETFKCHFETAALHAKLRALGFRTLEDLSPAVIRGRFFAGKGGNVPDRGGHLLLASTF